MRYFQTFRILLLAALMVLSGAITNTAQASVKAWEGTISIPTYTWGPDDINPAYYALEGSIIYPYTMQDNLSTEKVDVEYKAFHLENEYLRVTCLPELGGRIHSVFDKSSGEEMFHRNDVIKPGLIAMRGAWISGGIEWNTGPHGHTVTVVSPVNVRIIKNRDGSASLLISNTEQIFRTRWTVRLTLHPGKAYLDERISLYNPQDGIHPYYFWNCTAFPCLPGTRFIYPMTLGTNHSGDYYYSWPIHEGKDLSWLKNYDRPSSVFAYDCEFDFFGAYDVDLDRGIVQYADHNILIGKKAWTWGQSDDGLVSQANLHEGDEQYIEVQSGPLLTQADYGLLYPRERVAWREWWYPVHGLGDGFEYATRDLAIQTHRSREEGVPRLDVSMISTARYDRAECTLTVGDDVWLRKTVNLSPEESVKLTLKPAPTVPIRIEVRTQSGKILVSYSSPLDIPEKTPPEPSWLDTKNEEAMTAEECYLKGLLFDKQTNREAAREWYQKALNEDANYSPALRNLAVLDLEVGLYQKAEERLKRAVERDMDDGMAWFYLGAVQFKQDKLEQALESAYQAVKIMPNSGLGYELAGRVYMRERNYREAVEAFERASVLNPPDKRARNHLLLARFAYAQYHDFGMLGGTFEAAETLAKQYPTDLLPHSVLALMNANALERFARGSREFLGEDAFETEELIYRWLELGLWSEAEAILTACMEHMPDVAEKPMPHYLFAYIAGHLDHREKADEALKLAASLPTDYVFPSRPESIDVLANALEQNPDDAHARLYLGNLYGGLGRLDEAVEEWRKAVELKPSLSVAQRNLGLYAWKEENDLRNAADYYRKAIAARPEDQTLYYDLAQILISDGQRPQAIALLESMPQPEERRTDIIEVLAQAYVDEERFSDAIALLDNAFFSNWENRTVSRNVFVRAHIERGKLYMEQEKYELALDDFTKALTYPKHLGVGRPAEPQEAEAYYWKGKALAALDREDEAKEAWQIGADGPKRSQRQREYIERCEEALIKAD